MATVNTTYLLHEDTHPLHKVLMLMQKGAPRDQIDACLQTVPLSIRNTLYGKVYEIAKPKTKDHQWGEHHATDDYSCLTQAIHNYAIDTFRALPERRAVHDALYDIACRPGPSDLFWDLHHPEEDPIRLLAALKRTNNLENPKVERFYTQQKNHPSRWQTSLLPVLCGKVADFLQPNETALLERVCLSFRNNLNVAPVWKRQCLNEGIDISALVNYKDAFARPNIPEAFGREAWQKRNYTVGYEPPLPWNIRQILKTANLKHIALVPAGITPNLLETVFNGVAGFDYFWQAARDEHGNTPISVPSYWSMDPLGTVFQETRGMSADDRVKFIKELNEKNQATGNNILHIPSLPEAITLCFTYCARTGQYLYGRAPRTYTLVTTKTQGWFLAVGGFAPGGLYVNDYYDGVFDGVAGSRKFCGHWCLVTWTLAGH